MEQNTKDVQGSVTYSKVQQKKVMLPPMGTAGSFKSGALANAIKGVNNGGGGGGGGKSGFNYTEEDIQRIK